METRAFASVTCVEGMGVGEGEWRAPEVLISLPVPVSGDHPSLPAAPHPPPPPGSLDSLEYSLGPPGDKSLSPSLDPDN